MIGEIKQQYPFHEDTDGRVLIRNEVCKPRSAVTSRKGNPVEYFKLTKKYLLGYFFNCKVDEVRNILPVAKLRICYI